MVKNTFPGRRLVPLSYRRLLSSSLSDCYTTSPSDETLSSPGRHSHSSKLHPKMVFISFFRVRVSFLPCGDDSESTAGAGRVIFNQNRLSSVLWELSKHFWEVNLITLHHETDHGEH